MQVQRTRLAAAATVFNTGSSSTADTTSHTMLYSKQLCTVDHESSGAEQHSKIHRAAQAQGKLHKSTARALHADVQVHPANRNTFLFVLYFWR